MPLDANGAMGGIVGHRVRGSEESPYSLDAVGYGMGQERPMWERDCRRPIRRRPAPASRKEQKMKSLLRSAALPGERGSAPHAENVRTVHRGPGSSSPAGPPCKFSFRQIFIPQVFSANFHGFLSYSRHFPRANDKMVTGFRKPNSFSLPALRGARSGITRTGRVQPFQSGGKGGIVGKAKYPNL